MGDQTNGEVVHIGPQPAGLLLWKTINVCYHDFTKIDSEKTSPEFTFGGNTFQLEIGDDEDERTSTGYVSLFLENTSDTSDEAIDVDVFFSVRSANGTETVRTNTRRHTFSMYGETKCVYDFATRSTLRKSLYHAGTLIIQVWMKLPGDTVPPQNEFVPSNPIRENMLAIFGDEESSDVVFEVSGDTSQENTENKKAKYSTTFHAHYSVLQCNAPVLADMCKSFRGKATSLLIEDVTPTVFRQVLYYVYGGEVEQDEKRYALFRRNAKEIIDVANKYGIVHLKLKAEVYYVRSTIITTDNVIDKLLYADSKNCALLKEAAIDWLVKNAADVMDDEVCLDNVPNYTMNDLLAATARANNMDYDANDYNLKSVGELRSILHNRGLDIDGSRKMMIARLRQQHYSLRDDTTIHYESRYANLNSNSSG